MQFGQLGGKGKRRGVDVAGNDLEQKGIVQVDISFINTRTKNGIEGVKKCDGCIVPGGF